MEQRQSTMTTRVASRLKKKHPNFSSCENETYWNTLSLHKRGKKKCQWKTRLNTCTLSRIAS